MSTQSTINREVLEAVDSVRPSQHTPATQSHPVDQSRKSSWLERCLTAGMVICFALAGWHFAGNPASEASVAESTSPVPAVTSELGAADASGPTTTSIEKIRLGQRVVGKNPLRHETQSPSNIAPENWRAVQLSMYLGEVRYDLNFLRSLDWLKATAAAPGRTVHMQLPEMGLNGPALVEAIAPCPPIEPDDGTGRQIVTGTMVHEADNILDLHITGLEEPLGVTTTHPIWSETRQHFVKAGQLEIGEHLRSTTGHLAEVTRITPHRGPPQPTYNLEVNAEHVYQVGQSGLLVHNDCIHMHHSTPRAIQKRLKQAGNPAADDLDVIGRPGLPNRIPVPAQRHVEIHGGKGYVQNGGIGGGHYNNAFDRLIRGKNGTGPGYKDITKDQILEIRDFLVRQFEL